MGIESAQEGRRWSIFPEVKATRSEKRALFTIVAVFSAFCFAMGYVFTLYYRRPDTDVGIVLLSSAISVTGFLAVLLPPTLYLRVYNPFWTVLTFVISTGLLFLLVSHKYIVTRHTKVMTDDFIARDAFSAYISAGLFEEIVKLITYIVPIMLCRRYRTVYDLCFFAICSGCTFASLENLAASYYGATTALHRFLWCTATHTSDCLSGALILAHIKTRDFKRRTRWAMYPCILLVPTVLHGTFDFVIFVGEDAELDWLRFMSILVGAVSLAVSVSLFWPFRRSAQVAVVSPARCVAGTLSAYPLV
jgi:RsiW-degrading membrane proteinase PrsW (M82 family)